MLKQQLQHLLDRDRPRRHALIQTQHVHAGELNHPPILENPQFENWTAAPNDVDCVLLIGAGFRNDHTAEQEILAGLPFLQIELAESEAFQDFVNVVFASDRKMTPKGVIEVQ